MIFGGHQITHIWQKDLLGCTSYHTLDIMAGVLLPILSEKRVLLLFMVEKIPALVHADCAAGGYLHSCDFFQFLLSYTVGS